MKKYLNYLFFFGLILAIAGIVAGEISGTWSFIAISLSVAGGVILIVWLGLFLKANKNFWSLRSTEAGTNAIISTLAVILILILVNFLAFRYSTRIDFTETKLFTISPQSKEIVANLSQDLNVYIFEPQANAADQALLENYKRNNSNFNFEFINPQINLQLTKEFNVQRPGEVYLKYGDKKQLVQNISAASRLSETQLTNAIAKIKLDKQLIIYILQGHGEPTLEEKEGSLSQAVTALTDKGYEVKPLILVTNPLIPPDANAVIIANPKRELLQGEVKTLEKYINSGGNLLVMLDANIKSGLDSLLKECGITLDNRLVVDASGAGETLGLGPATTLITKYGAHPITKDFTNNDISVFPLARAIKTTSKEGIEAIALLISNEQTWAEFDLESSEVQFNINEDIKGPLDIGVALVRKAREIKTSKMKITIEKNDKEKVDSPDSSVPKIEEKEVNINNNNEKKEENNLTLPTPPEIKNPDKQEIDKNNSNSIQPKAKMVIIGNSTFATNGWFQQQLNSDIFLNSVNWLANDDVKNLSIKPKEAKNRRLNITKKEAGIIGWLALFIVPGFGLIMAIFTWRKRSK